MAGDLLKEGLTVVGLVAIVFLKDWRLAILSLVGMPLAFYPLVRLGRHLRASSETSLRRWRDISEILQETISGFRVGKAFAMEGFEIARFPRASGRRFPLSLPGPHRTEILAPLAAGSGEIVAIVGTSGAGKTTLMTLLPRFYDVTEGTILVDGTDVRQASLKSLREQIGLVTQETVLFNDTVRANIAYGLEAVDE